MSDATDRTDPSELDAPATEDDYDLLTFHEAGTRLDAEITLQQRRLAGLGNDAQAHAACRERLRALEAAKTRNDRGSMSADDFARFFGYRPS